MNLTHYVRPDDGATVYTLEITAADRARVHLHDFDRRLLSDIDHGPPSATPIADVLVGVETIARRIEEQA